MKLYEISLVNTLDDYAPFTYFEVVKDRGSHRCIHCGRFKKKNGHCSLEVPVNGGWSWEHY